MLYDGALRFMEAGKAAMSRGDLSVQNEMLKKAQNIVLELMSCLDMNKGGEIASNLMKIYGYVMDQLVLGNMQDDVECINRCLKIMSDLRESWSQLAIEQSAPQLTHANAA
jgi:flagellar protein FliS